MKLRFIPTNTPRLFDTSLPSFRPPKDRNYQGHKVRIHVKVPPKEIDYEKWLEKRRREAEKMFVGANILLVPEFQEEKHATELPKNSTDRQKIVAYVEQTIPEEIKREVPAVVEYLCSLLGKVSGSLRTSGKQFGKNRHGTSDYSVHFKSVFGENVLNFKRVQLEFSRGVHLVIGRNEDWSNGSNGSGKSNLLQLLRIGLYGSTTKGQSHDRLVRRNSSSAEVSRTLVHFVQSKQNYQIERQRRPVRLMLSREGRDVSSGNSKKRTGISTQEMIEQSVGMTEEMFDHSVIIDQKLLNTAGSFMSGTDKEKKELLDSFLGTARFLAAGELVRKENSQRALEENHVDQLIESKKEIVRVLEQQLKALRKDNRDRLSELKSEITKKKKELTTIGYSAEEEELLRKRHEKASQNTEAAKEEWRPKEQEVTLLDVDLRRLKKEKEKLLSKKPGQVCPSCQQPIQKKHLKGCLKEIEEKIHQTLVLWTQARIASKRLKSEYELSKQREDAAYTNLKNMIGQSTEASRIKSAIDTLGKQLEKESRKGSTLKLSRKIYSLRNTVRRFKTASKALVKRKAFLDYCELVLSRRGLVNFLYEQVCGQLNQSAKDYSEIFTNGVIQLRFSPVTQRKNGEMVNEFSIQVVNSQGGEAREDQSRGEEQLAALMCILCLREIGPRSNLLILDEPTEGLDPINSRRFTEGLMQLEKKFHCILIATHNQDIRARLKEENALLVVKKKRIARLERIGVN